MPTNGLNDVNESLSEKLRSLGVKTGAKNILPPRSETNEIQNIIDGNFVDSDFGPLFKKNTLSDNAYTHGSVFFNAVPITSRFTLWADPTLDPSTIDLSTTVFLDTETTGLAGGTGTIPFMVGLGQFTSQGFLVTQLFMRDPAEERALLDILSRFLTGVRTIVTYNGKAFDIPILKTRYILNNLPFPLNELAHFDLLPLSRRLWKRRLESRSLKDIELEIIGFSRDQIEVPGWEIPILYFNYLRTGDAGPLAGVFYHNVIDIQSLAAIFLLMNTWAENPQVVTNLEPVDALSLAFLIEDTGEIETAVDMYERLLSVDFPVHFHTELQLRYARILKRNGRYDRAAEVLHTDELHKEIQVMIQLAKVLEHQQRNFRDALEWTIKAQNLLSETSSSIPPSEVQKMKEDLQKRITRLKHKIENETAHE